MDVLEINVITNEVIERAFTPDEITQRKADAASAKAETSAKEAAASERLTAITAARDHAASLGFTNAMLAVMYPQPAEAPSE